MDAIIELNSELLVDRSRIRSPYLQLLLTAFGQELAKGSAWVAIDKTVASEYPLPAVLIAGRVQHAA